MHYSSFTILCILILSYSKSVVNYHSLKVIKLVLLMLVNVGLGSKLLCSVL